MLKAVVFDSGWGGDLIADYLEHELPIEIERVIDWRNGPYGEKTPGEIWALTEKALAPHIYNADVIVLTETATALTMLERLRQEYPGQIFVGYGWDLEIMMRRFSHAMILANEGAKRSEIYQHSKAHFSDGDLAEPDCIGWESRIDEVGGLQDEEIRRAVGNFRGPVILYSPTFLELKPQLRAIAGKHIRIIDMRRALLRDVCLGLKLRGVDGRAPRDRFAQ